MLDADQETPAGHWQAGGLQTRTQLSQTTATRRSASWTYRAAVFGETPASSPSWRWLAPPRWAAISSLSTSTPIFGFSSR